ncbi:hypothetical protein B0A49_02175 [Cryomyces minteri]|uniref:Small ribosomal subunit protein uS7m n=1 Tax=Cryomyces minteri TaxID=331657 RepID=A0A4U0XTG8_9PEZI|nr:hypothetical protein B0A49_02175 [Cryomyces minteri]
MPPRLNLLLTPRVIAYRSKPAVGVWRAQHASKPQPTICAVRGFADKSTDLPVSEDDKGPNTDPGAPHVSEEAAAMAKVTGGSGPDLEQGTPVQEVVKDDKEAFDKLPQVMKDSIRAKTANPKPQTRPYSTSAIRRADLVSQEPAESYLQEGTEVSPPPGLRFELPDLPLPSTSNMEHRYDPVVAQVTNLLMRDGKLSVAQRNMALILQHLRTASPPQVSPTRPLLPGAPPPSHLPLNPVLYLTLAIDSVAPLLRIRSQRGAAGGGVALQIPVPLGLRQRRRQAMQWILDAASKKQSRGSGRGGFAQKVAEELVSVVEGRSGVWDRRGAVHKLGVSARANLNFGRKR